MNNTLLVVLLVISSISLLSGSFASSAHGQISQNVVINELDINPPGSDGRFAVEWVELYNPTDSAIDISGWEIASTTTSNKTLTLPTGTVIQSQDYLVFLHQSLWFSDTVESVELRDQNNTVIDKTPILSDIDNDFNSWQRVFDGFDLDSFSDWKFELTTYGGSNGEYVLPPDALYVTVSTTEPSYTLGQTAVIQGTVSKLSYADRNSVTLESVNVIISGLDFERTTTTYPDSDLGYSATLNLQQTLRVNAGLYNVTAIYGDASATTQFLVNPADSGPLVMPEPVVITTDKSQYFPGETVSITGVVTGLAQHQGMTFRITDSNDDLVADGTLFPTDGEVLTSVFLSNIDPVYGAYTVTATYARISTSISFNVLEATQDADVILLSTTKPAFGLGDTVQVNGRLNHVWTDTLDLEITQTTLSGTATDFEIVDELNVSDDGLFDYTFTVADDSSGIGLYTITFSQSGGLSSSILVHVISNPDEIVASDDIFTVSVDKDVYTLGNPMVISGLVTDTRFSSVHIDGSKLRIFLTRADDTTSSDSLSDTTSSQNSLISTNELRLPGYDFTVLPDSSGRYSLDVVLDPSTFSAGNYIVTLQSSDRSATNTFTVVDSLSFIDGPIITLDKQIYGLGETIVLSGIAPTTATFGVDIFITKPDGSVIRSGTSVDDQRFSWSWVTPTSELRQNLQTSASERIASKSNFGIYKLEASVDNLHSELFFKVSSDPENDSISTSPLQISTEKSLYLAPDILKITGNILKQQERPFSIPPRVTIQVIDANSSPSNIIYESQVYPQSGGSFSSSFDLPFTVFTEGTYIVKALYQDDVDTATFGVVNDYGLDVDDSDVSLLLSTNNEEYALGDVVTITGLSSRLTFVESFDVSISQQTNSSDAVCDDRFCGVQISPTVFIPPTSSASFTYHFTIPDTESALGSYQVTADAGFDTESILFVVKESVTAPPSSLPPSTVIVKENRIPHSNVDISTPVSHIHDTDYHPRVLSGSLVTPSQADQLIVNIKVSTPSGLCIIGPDANCLVSESTQRPGSIYDVVEIDGTNFNVRYSGPDVRLEKFSILPESSDAFLPDTDWNVQILKDDQVSRFYYKITYKSLFLE